MKEHHATTPRTTGRGQRPSSAAASYSAVKDQLVSLSLEIEDCSQAAELLREALDKEQQKATKLPQEVAAPFNTELEAADSKDKAALAQHLQTVDKLLERKRVLSVEAKGLLEQVKIQRTETAIAVENVREQGKAEVVEAQATWAEGEDTRREKWIARRTKEIRELTLKGLEPEIERIMDKHKADMDEAERGHDRDAQRTWKHIARKTDEALTEERTAVRCRVEKARREAMEATAERRQAMTDKHHGDVDRVKKRAAGEAEAQRRWQEEEMRRLEGVTAADITRLHNEQHSRWQAMSLQHAEDAALASRRRTAALASLARECELDREEWGRRAKEQASAGDEAIKAEQERLIEERDKKIDGVVRRLQRERLDNEKTTRTTNQQEKARLTESHAEGMKLLSEKQTQWEQRHAACTDALHSLVDKRREVALKSKELAAEAGLLSSRADKSEATLKAGASAARDEEARVLREHQELMSESRLRRAELQQKIADEEREASTAQTRNQAALSTLREDHDRRLEALHEEVKLKVNAHDVKISRLREAVHTESLRAEHASKMLAKYVKQAHIAADAAAGTTDTIL